MEMKELRTKIARKIIEWLSAWAAPSHEDLVRSLILHTASLRLLKSEFVDLSPIQGTCGNFKLEGNSLPVVTYVVFEKKIMEFIQVRVEVSKPDRMQFVSTISSTTAPELHGKEVETVERYKQPFLKLLRETYNYFPLTRKAVDFHDPFTR